MCQPGESFRVRWYLALATVSALVATTAARAAHPLLTEDTLTQGAGNAELELGMSWTRVDADRFFLFQPQLSYGLLPTLDLIVQPQWLVDRTATAGSPSGFGDTLLDAKWHFYGDPPLSFAMRAGITLPTGDQGRGFSSGKPSGHALLVTTIDAAPFTIDANAGYVRNLTVPGLRRDLYHVSAAAVFATKTSLSLVADIGFDSNPDSSRSTWPGFLLAGMIYTLQAGLDVDVGYQTRLNHAAPAQQWLLGITYRWAP
jgi:hypothetical protein